MLGPCFSFLLFGIWLLFLCHVSLSVASRACILLSIDPNLLRGGNRDLDDGADPKRDGRRARAGEWVSGLGSTVLCRYDGDSVVCFLRKNIRRCFAGADVC